LSVNPPLRQVLQMDVFDPLVRNDKSSFISGFGDMQIEDVDESVTAMVEDVVHAEGDVPGDKQGEKQGTNQGGSVHPP